MYDAAYSLYQQGNYQDASILFTQLALQDPTDEKVWRGLASSQQMQGNFKEALDAWSVTALLAGEDPYPHFHAAECLLSLDDKEQGHKALKSARERVKDNSDELLTKIELLLGL